MLFMNGTYSQNNKVQERKKTLFERTSSYRALLLFALKDVSKSRAVLILTIISLSMAFSTAFLARGVFRGFEAAMVNGTIETGGHLSVRPSRGLSSIADSNAIKETLSQMGDVEAYSVRSHGRLAIVQDGKTFGAGYATVGVDPIMESQTTNIPSSIIEGRFVTPDEKDGIVFGVTLADAAVGNLYDGKTAHVGQSVRFRALSGQEKEYTIVGIIDAKYFHPNWSVYFAKEELEYLDNGKQNDEIAVKLRHPEHLDTVQNSLQERLQGIQVFTWLEREGYVFDMVTTFRTITSSIDNFLALAVFAVTATTVFLNIFQKRRQIGIIKSMGTSRNAIVGVYLFETAVYLSFSFTLGLLVFLFIYIYSLQHPMSLLLGEFRVQCVWSDIGAIGGIWMIAAFLGGFIPSYVAARTSVSDVLRDTV